MVIAVSLISEDGCDLVDNDAKPLEPGWLHANVGDLGVVEFVDSFGHPTVRFARTGTSTRVCSEEVFKLPVRVRAAA